MSDSRRRTEVVRARLTPQELAVLRSAAAARGLGISTFVRLAIVKAIGGKAHALGSKAALAKALATWTGQLGQIANTLVELREVTPPAHSASRTLQDLTEQLRALHEVVVAAAAQREGSR
jgi:hypothetical protein